MDYKEKYEAALERARKLKEQVINNEIIGFSGQFDEIFPELSESEDERIRKTLIEELSACNTVGELKFRLPAPTREECIAWLEKQKEKVSDEFDENYKIGNYHSGLILAWVNQPSTLQPAHKYHGKNVVAIHLKKGGFRCCCIDDPSPSTFEIPDGTLSPLCGEWHNRKSVEKEQQPTEWSEEGEMVVMSPYEAEFCKKFCGHTPGYYTAKGWKIIKNDYAEFKEIVMRELAEQKPVEWSEEDERMICPKCGEKMILDEGKVYTSIPPMYGYKCPKCGNYEYSTKKLI